MDGGGVEAMSLQRLGDDIDFRLAVAEDDAVLDLAALDQGGPYGAGWPAPLIVAGPMRVIKADVVGNGHLRAIMGGEDGRSIKTIAFRRAETELGQAILGAPRDRRLWVAGRAKIDDWGSRPAAELHLEDAAWAD